MAWRMNVDVAGTLEEQKDTIDVKFHVHRLRRIVMRDRNEDMTMIAVAEHLKWRDNMQWKRIATVNHKI